MEPRRKYGVSVVLNVVLIACVCCLVWVIAGMVAVTGSVIVGAAPGSFPV